MKPIPGVLVAISLFLVLSSSCASAQTGPLSRGLSEVQAPLARIIPGEEFLPPAVRAQQADDFDNPAFPSVQEGEAAWSRPDGETGKSCQDCHGAGQQNSVRHAAASYPKYAPAMKQVITLETRINLCRQNALRAPALADGSSELVAMTAYLRWLSKGLPSTVIAGGPDAPVFERGAELFHTKAGLLQLSCAQCHNQKAGQKFGAETLSQGHTSSYPVYSLSERRMIPLHERFRMCNQLVRAEPQPLNAPDYVALELYLAWRGRDLPLTAPGVRP